MPRTVPKTVEKAGRAANKRITNRKVRFMESHSPQKGLIARPPSRSSGQRMLGKAAARQAAAETKRGGGERGSMERRKSKGFANSIGDLIAAEAGTATDGGSTKAIEVTTERSES